ncbi:type II toxin-antitoxin system PemK/MazF family toxin [Salaquimonas pukyongi]|uniref:type II toxin-antitoxin system PemK/MazF family toxin n=1 Tax=Salaquimonas pukyongi TaxID=2712698 RepID=UPI0012EC4D84|nr:type II toxin-antitoxin system PemK/MazF family toxin [Salaquimonas pukyongi]
MTPSRQFNRYDVWLFNPEPARGSEIRKVRPCVVVSPLVMNDILNTVIVAPMTSTRKKWPSRVPVRFEKRDGDVALDQVRAVDKTRLERRLGKIAVADARLIARRLVEIFQYE